MRSEFEKWYRDKHQITKPLYFFEDTQRYEDGFTQDAWEVWQHQQSKVDELQCEVKRINLWYSNVKLQLENKEIDSAIDAKKIDELQHRNKMLNDNIKEQGQKLVYQNEVIETQSEKLLGLRDEKAELQKRVDVVKGLAQTLWEKSEEKHQQGKVWESKTLGECADEILDVLEQALKGGEA